MKIQFTAKEMTVPTRVYNHAELRIQELAPLFKEEPEALVVFSANEGKHAVELTVLAGNTVIRVVERTPDMLVTIDAAVSAVRRQVMKNRERLAAVVAPKAFEEDTDELVFIPEVDQMGTPSYQVLRSKQFEFGSMGVEEAILQMNLIGHNFFAFRNAEKDDAFCVVYKRFNGGYGILVDKT